MPWQRFVADVGCELDERGNPAYGEVIVTVPRQSGKTSLFTAWQIDRCLNWGSEPQQGGLRAQRSAFTAQTGGDARDKWLDELFPLIKASPLIRAVRQMNRANGNEAIYWRTGSIIRLLSTATSSGHSKTLDQAVLDEIWHDTDDRREQGLRPAMITRSDAQLLVCSTAGTQASSVLNHKRQVGRAAVEDDSGSGVAYFEWSAPDDWDPSDESTYVEFMPALCPDPPCRCDPDAYWHHTIGSIERIRSERLAMKSLEFVRAYGNRTTSAVDSVIPLDRWAAACDADVSPSGMLRFAVDVSEDRQHAAICAAGGGVIELVEHRSDGTGWLAARCNELSRKHGAAVAIDASGPAAVLADQLERVELISASDALAACGRIYDAIIDGHVKFRAHPDLDSAVNGLARRQNGDRWGWSRKASSVDIAPFMAATLAFAARTPASLVTF